MAPRGLASVLDLEGPPRTTGATGVPKHIRELIRQLSRENPLWGAPRIHGELLKLGTDIGETSVGKYLVRRKPLSQTWRSLQVLYVFLVLARDRRRIVHFNVTAHPTAEWTSQQLREAFPFDQVRGIFFVTATASLAASFAER